MSEEMILEVDQPEIDWSPGHRIFLTGKINAKPWRADFIRCSEWIIRRQHGDNLTEEEIESVKLYLTQQTPPFVERILRKKTKLYAMAILTLIGIGAAATVVAIIKRHHDNKSHE